VGIISEITKTKIILTSYREISHHNKRELKNMISQFCKNNLITALIEIQEDTT